MKYCLYLLAAFGFFFSVSYTMAQVEIPANCERWFDGCSVCDVLENGELFCMEASCPVSMTKEPYCAEFSAPQEAKIMGGSGDFEIPQTCTSWFDGCNTCMAKDGVLGGCTRKYCETTGVPLCLEHESTYQPPEPVDLPDPYAVPANCKLWHDGCRNCKISRDGEKNCEQIECFYQGPSECLEYYEDEVEEALVVGNEKPAPGQAKVLKLNPEPDYEKSLWGFIKYHLFFWQK